MVSFVRSISVSIISLSQWIPPLAARIVLGLVFTKSGWAKLHHLPKVVEFFTSLGIPFPYLQAPLVACFELGCGILLISGLFTRIATLPLMTIMTVAIFTAKISGVTGFSDVFTMTEFLYIILLFWLMIGGAGPLSIDRFWGRDKI